MHLPASTSPFSGAAATVKPAERERLYARAGDYISEHAYTPFGPAFTADVHGPGLTTLIPPIVVNAGVIRDEVWRSQE